MKRKVYFWSKKHIHSENVKLMVLLIPLIFILVQQLKYNEFDWLRFFDISFRKSPGGVVVGDGTNQQKAMMVKMAAADREAMARLIALVEDQVSVLDDQGVEMLLPPFDPRRLTDEEARP